MPAKVVLALLIVCASAATSQPPIYINLRGDSCMYSSQRAAFLYFENFQEATPETTILVYIKQGFWWHAPEYYDSTTRMIYDVTYHFTIDSITGRGDKRRAMFSHTTKYLDTSKADRGWLWLLHDVGASYPDSVNPNLNHSDSHWDTLGTMPDTLRKISYWLSYSRRVLDPVWGKWYIYTAEAGDAWDWSAEFPDRPYNWRVKVRMEKILGDPTVNYGWNQRAVLKMSLCQVPNDSLRNAVSIPGP